MTDQGPLVLIVDDEPHITHVLALKLRNAGFEVITAGDGEEALEAATSRTPAVVITDLQMPYMDGLEFCKALKKQESTQSVPALMLTARGFSLARADIELTNIREVLSKPFSPREILLKVNAILGITTESEGIAA